MSFTEATAHKILNKILRNTDFTHPSAIKVSLHTGNPGENGANEVTGGDYERKSVTFIAPGSKATSNDAAIEWENMPACTVKYVGLWDTAGMPGFWLGGILQDDKVLGAGDTLRIKQSDLTVGLE